MADTAATITRIDHWHDGKRQFMIGTIALAAGDYIAGGIPLDFRATDFKGTQKPFFLVIDGIAGYIYVYDRSTGTLRIFQQIDPAHAGGANIPLPEVSGALAAGLTGDTIRFLAIGQISG